MLFVRSEITSADLEEEFPTDDVMEFLLFDRFLMIIDSLLDDTWFLGRTKQAQRRADCNANVNRSNVHRIRVQRELWRGQYITLAATVRPEQGAAGPGAAAPDTHWWGERVVWFVDENGEKQYVPVSQLSRFMRRGKKIKSEDRGSVLFVSPNFQPNFTSSGLKFYPLLNLKRHKSCNYEQFDHVILSRAKR